MQQVLEQDKVNKLKVQIEELRKVGIIQGESAAFVTAPPGQLHLRPPAFFCANSHSVEAARGGATTAPLGKTSPIAHAAAAAGGAGQPGHLRGLGMVRGGELTIRDATPPASGTACGLGLQSSELQELEYTKARWLQRTCFRTACSPPLSLALRR